MKIPKISTLLCIVLIIATGCTINTEPELVYSISGRAQKGPFLVGSLITLSEIDENLFQSGKTFITNTQNDEGYFEFNNMDLNSGSALITATGFYFNEVYGSFSHSQITLQAYVDLKDKSSVNVNVLTHLTRQRIEKLVSEGKKLKEAKFQAENEFLNFLGANDSIGKEFEDMDLLNEGDENGLLLAFSVISQRYEPNRLISALSVYELSELLNKLGNDLKDDGNIGEQALIDTLIHNANQLNLGTIRKNIESKYPLANQGKPIADFEKYVFQFKQKHSKQVSNDFIYPLKASPDPLHYPDAVADNILCLDGPKTYKSGPMALGAFVPLGAKLRIVAEFDSIVDKNKPIYYLLGSPNYGWKIVASDLKKGFTIESELDNVLIGILFYSNSRNATITFFENDMVTPAHIRKIRWIEP